MRYTWGRVICGCFFPPVLLQGQQEGTGEQTHGEMVMPPRPTPHLILIQRDQALVVLELRLDGPAAHGHPRQRLPRRVGGRVGEKGTRLRPIEESPDGIKLAVSCPGGEFIVLEFAGARIIRRLNTTSGHAGSVMDTGVWLERVAPTLLWRPG